MSVAVLLPLVLALAGPIAPSRAADPTLTNGCTHNARGIPTCGAYFGGAYGANSDVTPWENSMGKNLGVHRTYWGSGSVASAVSTAKADAAKNRVPWMSFKAPYSWADMAAGRGDAWARDLATRMKATGGPVWVAVAHEPENDGGDIQKWKAMQARIAPIMRAAAPNLGFSIILMGYHELHGDKKFALSAIWPNTKVDVAGFDVYEKYGVKNITIWKDFINHYYEPLQAWSAKTGVKWGLAETGYSDPAANKNSGWMSKTYKDMVAHGGIAFSYFNTNLHSVANWRLSTATKQNSFTAVNRTAPTIR
jgi:hypothetical protein